MTFKNLTKVAIAAVALSATPATSQVIWQPIDYAGQPISAPDPAFDQIMPSVTTTESSAMLVWHFRSALNLAALQCGFEPTMRTLPNYVALLENHRAELSAAYLTITNYFKRTRKAGAQSAQDTFSTRIISRYSTVRGQVGFCEQAGIAGHLAKFAPRGGLAQLARERLPYLRNAQKPFGDQLFAPQAYSGKVTRYPSTDPSCWDKNSMYVTKCGYQ